MTTGVAAGRALVLALTFSACGASLARAPSVPVAPRAAPIAAPSPRVTSLWSDARGAYDAARVGGLDADECADLVARFEAVDGAQTGGVAQAAYMIGVIDEACGRPDAATRAFERAVTLAPELCEARVAIADGYERAEEPGRARAELEGAVRDDPGCGEGWLALARWQRRAGERDAALTSLRRALALDARPALALEQLARVHLDQAMARGGSLAHVQGGGLAREASVLASDHEAARLLDLAAVECRQAQLLDADRAPLYNTWALVELGRGEITPALAMLERARALDPSLFEAQMNFGELTLSYRGYEDARAAFAQAVSLRPDDYDALVGLGAALRGLGEVDAADAAYERAVSADPARPEAYFDRGLLYQEHRGGDAASLRIAREQYRLFVERAAASPELAPVVERVTRECPSICRASAVSARRPAEACTMGRLQQIDEALCLLETVGDGAP